MDLSNIHPLIVHFPIALIVVSALLLFAHWLFLRKQGWLRMSALVLLIAGSFTLPLAAQTGKWAEEAAEEQATVRESTLEAHEHAGELLGQVGLGTGITLGLLLASLLLLGERRKLMEAALELAAVLALGFMLPYLLDTARLGGELVYDQGAGVRELGGQGAPQLPLPEIVPRESGHGD